MALNIKRVFNFALVDFMRNKGTSIAAIFILAITTLLVTMLFLLQGASSFLVSTVQDKIDIAAYFKSDTAEANILSAKDEIIKDAPGIKSIDYISKDQALANFTEKNKGNDVLNKALSEVGGNPFLPSLNITTNGDPAEYEQINAILQSDKYNALIDKVDFSQKKDTIEKVFSITSNINKFGIILGIILTLIAISVVFNTLKLVIDNSKDEINTMTIVGASSWFVRAPFILEGAIFGVISFVLCLIATLFLSYSVSGGIEAILPGFNMFDYFISHIFLIMFIQILCGVGLGVVSSFIVVTKYLKV